MDLFKMVQDFHEKFDLPIPDKPKSLDEDMLDFRTDFILEELHEYEEGYCEEDLEKQLDALVDMVYVIMGMAVLQGFNFNEAFRRVHEANMKKVRAKPDGSDSKRGFGLDVVKPEGWEAATLKDLT